MAKRIPMDQVEVTFEGDQVEVTAPAGYAALLIEDGNEVFLGALPACQRCGAVIWSVELHDERCFEWGGN